MKNNIYNYSLNELKTKFKENKIPEFRAKQVWNWLYANLVESFDEMKNIDKKTIEFLKEVFIIESYEVVDHQKDSDGTEKVLLKLLDGNTIETVLMKQKYGYSVCVTTQIGCAVGCNFCASGLLGIKRNLSSGEILCQIIYFQRQLAKKKLRVSQVVLMGIGEPFNNYQNTIKFIDQINDKDTFNIGARHITVSTSGIIPAIKEFTNYDKQVNLAISLHAPNNDVRNKIMKINKVYPIEELIEVVKDYIDVTNRRVTFEYIMLKDINDSDENANDLSKLLKGINAHVNLIKYNYVDENSYEPSNESQIKSFFTILEKNKINVTNRKEKGSNIDGACGQLRHKEEKRKDDKIFE